MVSAGDIPDVMEMPDTWLSLYANNGMLESLEPYLAKWEHTDGSDRPRARARPRRQQHRLYAALRLLSAGDVLQQEAACRRPASTAPPKTLDEFVAAAEKVSTLPGKYGYCMRGGPGGLNGWVMFAATMAGDNTFFNDDGTSTMNSEGWVKGLTWMRRSLQEGLCAEGQRQLGLQRDRRRLLHRHLRLPRPGPGRADRHRRAHEARAITASPPCRRARTARPSRPSAMPAGR